MDEILIKNSQNSTNLLKDLFDCVPVSTEPDFAVKYLYAYSVKIIKLDVSLNRTVSQAFALGLWKCVVCEEQWRKEIRPNFINFSHK